MVIRSRAVSAIKKEQRKKKLRRYAVMGGLLLLNVLIYMGALALTLRLPVFRIDQAVVQGVTGAREAEVRAAASELLTKNVLYIFPRYTTLTSPRGMTASLGQAIPWIEQASANLESPHTVHIRVTERQPAYLVCATGDECYYADTNTLVFAQAPTFSAPVYPELKSPRVASSTAMMTRVFMSDVSEKLRELIQLLQTRDITVTMFEETAEGSFRIHMREGWYVLFTADEPAQTVFDSLSAIMKSTQFRAEYAKHPRTLAYIDVRLVDKVFYKFKAAGSNATTTTSHN